MFLGTSSIPGRLAAGQRTLNPSTVVRSHPRELFNLRGPRIWPTPGSSFQLNAHVFVVKYSDLAVFTTKTCAFSKIPGTGAQEVESSDFLGFTALGSTEPSVRCEGG